MNTFRPFKVFIGRDVTANATGLDDLDNGEIVLLKRDMTLMSAGETITDSDIFYIAQGTATLGKPKISAAIQGRNVIKWDGNSYTAAAQQVAYIGWNGTNGDIEGAAGAALTDETTYSVTIEFLHDKDIMTARQDIHTFEFTTGTSTTSTAVVTDLVAQINAHTYVGALVTAAATAGATEDGISLTGRAQTYDVINGYRQVKFNVAISGGFTNLTQIDINGYRYVSGAAGTTTSAASVRPTPGTGTYALVSDLERFAQGFEGVANLTKFPVKNYPVYATSGTNYDVYVIEHTHKHQDSMIQATTISPRMEFVCIPAGTNLGLAFEAVANPYMASLPQAFNVVTL